MKYPGRSGAGAAVAALEPTEVVLEPVPPDKKEDVVDAALTEDDGLGTSSSIELGAEFVCFRTKHILRRSAALGRRVREEDVSPGDVVDLG